MTKLTSEGRLGLGMFVFFFFLAFALGVKAGCESGKRDTTDEVARLRCVVACCRTGTVTSNQNASDASMNAPMSLVEWCERGCGAK